MRTRLLERERGDGEKWEEAGGSWLCTAWNSTAYMKTETLGNCCHKIVTLSNLF
jgi:hypothetical protein